MTVTAPMTISVRPISDRATCGGTRRLAARRETEDVLGRDREREELVERRARVATGLLDLDHDGEDHRPSLGALVQVLREAVLDLCLEQAWFADVIAGVRDRGHDS